MRNSLKDEKLLKKTTYTSVNCLRVFGFYISILLFMSPASSKLNLKHRARLQKYPSGNLREALLSATDLIYNIRVYPHTRSIVLRLPCRHWSLLMNARNVAPRLESRHESVKIRLSRRGAGGGGGVEGGREELLKRYDPLCPSKNSFYRIIRQAPAAKLFQALSGMCWCYFQTRGSTLDLRSEQKGLLWILDEESIFPGANDSSFLARLYVHHCNDSEYKYIIQVMYADCGKCGIDITFLQPELLIFSVSFTCRRCFKKLHFPSPLANASPRLCTKQRK